MASSSNPEEPSKLLKVWHDWRGFVAFIAVMLVFRSAIADWNQVPTGSMIPAILVGDRIVVDKLAYDLRVPFTLVRIARWRDPERGEVVTFPSPADERLFIKRIIGIPGDRIELKRNQLTVNGVTANYRELSDTELERVNVPDKGRYVFLEESILGSRRVIKVDRQRRTGSYDTIPPLVVPAGHYLMLGDNRDDSGDYRVIGFVERDRILGEATAIAFSLDSENYWLPRMQRLFVELQ